MVTLELEALPLILHKQDSSHHCLQIAEDARAWASKKHVNLQESFNEQNLTVLHHYCLF